MRVHIVTLLTIVSMLGAAFSPSGYAAGSDGGGMGSGTYQENSTSASPELLSAKAFRAGVKHRDRALRFEDKAANARTQKAADKALARAQKYYGKAIARQGEALRLDPRNHEAANELGFALRKSGDFRKAIGAYNYALQLKPDFYPATEYRGEAFLALGMFDHARDAYMLLFREDPPLAAQLMSRFEAWRTESAADDSPARSDFLRWVEERKRLVSITAELSMNNTRSW